MFKVTSLFVCLVMAASANHIPYGPHNTGLGYEGEHYANPQYKFEYGVNDPHTGDHKSQWEVRDGDVVKGAYTMDEADGTQRVVEYVADDHNGFNAIVKRIGHPEHPQVYGKEAHLGYHQGHQGYSGNGYDGYKGYNGGASSYNNYNQYY